MIVYFDIIYAKNTIFNENNALFYQIRDLRLIARNGEIGNCPCSFLLSLEFASLKVLDDVRNKSMVDERLNLGLISSSYVRQKPYGLFDDLFLRMLQQRPKVIECTTVQHCLSLFVSSGDNVTHCPQGGRLHFDLSVGQKRYEFLHHARVNNHLYLFIAAVGQVA